MNTSQLTGLATPIVSDGTRGDKEARERQADTRGSAHLFFLFSSLSLVCLVEFCLLVSLVRRRGWWWWWWGREGRWLKHVKQSERERKGERRAYGLVLCSLLRLFGEGEKRHFFF